MTSTTQATNNVKQSTIRHETSFPICLHAIPQSFFLSPSSSFAARKMEDIEVPPGLLIPFLGAVQASISALLTIAIGVAAAQWGLLGAESSKQISRTCINLFLPLLLITNLGEELHLDTVQRYIPILGKRNIYPMTVRVYANREPTVWAFVCCLLSFYVGKAAVYIFRLPPWTTTALAFNNSTSLPLLLLQSLKTSGVLSTLVGNNDHRDAIERARSYFLVFAVVNNVLSFSMGTSELKGLSEDAPDEVAGRLKQLGADMGDQVAQPFRRLVGSDEESAGSEDDRQQAEEDEEEDERTSLLPHPAESVVHKTKRHINGAGKKFYHSLPGSLQAVAGWIACFIGPPSIGAVIGAIIGLTPALHRLFFNNSNKGGFFNAWLTTPIQNTGELFVTLQVIVVGIKLSLSLRRLKEGEGGGELNWGAVIFVTMWRFIVLPA